MDNLESRLRGLALRAPSQKLDERVLELKPEHPSRAPRRVPLWSAVALSLVMAGFGFAAGMTCRGAGPVATPGTRPPISVELICDSPTGTNPFDFTAVSSDFPAREWEITVINEAEKST